MLKGLVAIAPNGSFIFLSELFGGSISDRALFEKSGVLRLLDSVPPGKSVMADRGFEVRDLLVKPGLILNAPPFKGSRTALTEDEVKKTQKTARVRIHVERVIGQVKSVPYLRQHHPSCYSWIGEPDVGSPLHPE